MTHKIRGITKRNAVVPRQTVFYIRGNTWAIIYKPPGGFCCISCCLIFSTLNSFAIDVTSCPQLHLNHQLLNMLMNWNPHCLLLKKLDT
ncbi:unnamed protein product [Acanthoscelides obtectus]|uniref:Uncharacterized protein n=1 Tax=Acanthoscelides obtectus TaxID=200917 RepID=A0A9P0LCH9_ACAOB|nr:unnamed protein product [Acanthoscelides obtectus]CAK1671097.1 hypothetical protein AOBTE_LOCUS28053 [Acanthoscelides obtectus]